MQGQLTHEQAKTFILAGKATFTVKNLETDNRFTFKVVKPEDNTPHFVKVLTGHCNERSYTYLGTIFQGTTYKHGRKSRISKNAQSAQVFAWFWKHLQAGTLPDSIAVYHEGRCGRCGRKLTVPESILTGFGPECAQLVGAARRRDQWKRDLEWKNRFARREAQQERAALAYRMAYA